jgi:hypothetical protein
MTKKEEQIISDAKAILLAEHAQREREQEILQTRLNWRTKRTQLSEQR